MSAFSLPLILLTTLAAGPRTSAAPAERILVSASAIDAGTEVTPEAFIAKPRPAGIPAAATVPASELGKLLGRRTLEPLGAGEALRPTQLPTFYNTHNWQSYCDLLPEALRTRGNPDRPYPKRMSVDRGAVLVATQALPAGAVLEAKHLKPQKFPPEVAGPYAVPAASLSTAVGRKLIDPVVAGEVIRYPALVEYINEARCRWLYRAFGNAYVDRAPSDAATVNCPPGTAALSGIPNGPAWSPELPGWAVVCRRPDGTRHGAYQSWHRDSNEKFEVGQFTDGLRSGSWQQYNAQGRLQQQRTFSKGILQGMFARWTYKMVRLVGGQYDAGLRTGSWTFADWDGPVYLKSEYVRGLARGTWSFADTNGTAIGTGSFRNGLPHGRWAAVNWANKETAWVEYTDGKPGTVEGPQPFKLEPIFVAAHAMQPGAVVTRADLKPVMIPEPFSVGDFVRATEVSEIIGKPILSAVPENGWLLRLDFDLDNDAWKADPVPLKK